MLTDEPKVAKDCPRPAGLLRQKSQTAARPQTQSPGRVLTPATVPPGRFGAATADAGLRPNPLGATELPFIDFLNGTGDYQSYLYPHTHIFGVLFPAPPAALVTA